MSRFENPDYCCPICKDVLYKGASPKYNGKESDMELLEKIALLCGEHSCRPTVLASINGARTREMHDDEAFRKFTEPRFPQMLLDAQRMLFTDYI